MRRSAIAVLPSPPTPTRATTRGDGPGDEEIKRLAAADEVLGALEGVHMERRPSPCAVSRFLRRGRGGARDELVLGDAELSAQALEHPAAARAPDREAEARIVDGAR